MDRIEDAKPGPDVPLHALLDWERDAIVTLAEDWGEIDRSHRKLAHRGSRLGMVHVPESTVLRVLEAAGMRLPTTPARQPRPPRPWPQWAELVPGIIWIYHFTHFAASGRCAVAVLDVVSRLWLSTVVSAEESSTQVEVAFTQALITDGKDHLLENDGLLDELRSGVVPDGDQLPVLLALSDNGPQMTSKSTKAFMAGARIARHFGRPGTPNDQAWIESLFGHVKTEFPHREKITDPGELERELDRIKDFYNTVRLHQSLGYVTPESLGYVTPEDEHTGRGPAIRAARRQLRKAHPSAPPRGWVLHPLTGAFDQTHLDRTGFTITKHGHTTTWTTRNGRTYPVPPDKDITPTSEP